MITIIYDNIREVNAISLLAEEAIVDFNAKHVPYEDERYPLRYSKIQFKYIGAGDEHMAYFKLGKMYMNIINELNGVCL